MNRFFWILVFLCICLISLSQENCNLKINTNDVPSVLLYDFSIADSSLIRVAQDSSLSVSCVKNNLFYIEHHSQKYYFFLTTDTKLEIVVKPNNVVFNGENASFSYFLNDYFNLDQFSFKSKLDSSLPYKTIDEFEILLYDFINNEIFNFYQNHSSFQTLSDHSKAYFQNLIKYEYLNGVSTFLFEKSTSDSLEFISSLTNINIDLYNRF